MICNLNLYIRSVVLLTNINAARHPRPNYLSRKHAYKILTPLNPTFI